MPVGFIEAFSKWRYFAIWGLWKCCYEEKLDQEESLRPFSSPGDSLPLAS